MKLFRLFLLGGFLILTTLANSQDNQRQGGDLWTRLEVSEEEREQINVIEATHRTTNQEAKAEIEILRAEIKKASLTVEPNMTEVEDLIRRELTWVFKTRVAQVKFNTEIRKVLGEERYFRMLEIKQNMNREQARRFNQQQNNNKPNQR